MRPNNDPGLVSVATRRYVERVVLTTNYQINERIHSHTHHDTENPNPHVHRRQARCRSRLLSTMAIDSTRPQLKLGRNVHLEFCMVLLLIGHDDLQPHRKFTCEALGGKRNQKRKRFPPMRFRTISSSGESGHLAHGKLNKTPIPIGVQP